MRFRLERPGEGWQLSRGKSRSDALASAYDTEQLLSGDISVGHAPQAALSAYVDDWLQRLAFLEKSVGTRQKAQFQNCPAESFDVSGLVLDQPTLLRGVIFFHQNHVYRLTVRGRKDHFDRTRARRFFDSFTLLPGKIQESSNKDHEFAMSGTGWRIEGGRYESAISGLRIQAPPGWQLLVGDKLREFNPNADVAFVHDDPDASLAIRVVAAPEPSAPNSLSELQRIHSQNLHVTMLKDTVQLPVLGRQRTLRLGRTEFGNLFGYGVFKQGNRAIEVVVGYSELFQTTAPSLLEQVAGRVELLSEKDLTTLQEQLMGEMTDEQAVGPDCSLRNGCFRQYGQCFSWCKPRGFWDMTVGTGTHWNDSRLAAVARNVQTHMTVQIYSQPSPSDGPSLAQRLSEEKQLRMLPKRQAPGTAFSQVSSEYAQGERDGRSVTLHALKHRNTEIALLTICLVGDARCEQQVQSAVASLKLDDCVNAVEFGGNAFVDRRLGFAQALPGSFRLKSHKSAFGESGQYVMWESPEASLTMVTIVAADSSPNEFLESIEHATRASVPPTLLPRKRTSTMTVNGEIAQRASFVGLNYRFDTLVLKHKQVYIAWLLAGRNVDRVAELASGLQWSD